MMKAGEKENDGYRVLVLEIEKRNEVSWHWQSLILNGFNVDELPINFGQDEQLQLCKSVV